MKIKEHLYKIIPKEILRFIVCGSISVIIDFSIYNLLLFAGMNISLAKGISFICGSIVGFILNKLWTFESKQKLRQEIPKYVVLYACTAVINAAVNKVILAVTGIKIIAFLGATGISMVLNFLGLKFIVFRGKNGGQNE